MKISEMFSDGQYTSWTRIMGTPTVLTGLYGFVWSLMNKYDSGLIYSTGLIALALGAKSYQNHTESKLQDKIISEVSVSTNTEEK